MHMRHPRIMLLLSLLFLLPSIFAVVKAPAQITPITISDISSGRQGFLGYKPNKLRTCWEEKVVNGRQERMMRFTAMLMYPRLKLFRAMFKAKTQPKITTLIISK